MPKFYLIFYADLQIKTAAVGILKLFRFIDFSLHSKISDVDFSNTNLTNANFIGSTFSNVNFTNANITGCDFYANGSLTKEMIYSTSNYKEKNINDVTIYEGSFCNSDFSEQNFSNVAFYYLDLTGSSFKNANIKNTTFNNSILTNVDFTGATMSGDEDSAGLRLDMTKFMESDYTMKQIAAEINYHKPDAFLIAEDGRSSISVDDNGNFWNNYDEPHDKRVVNPLKSFESGIGQSEQVHCDAIENISNGRTTIGRLGFDSEWDFNYYHTLKDG